MRPVFPAAAMICAQVGVAGGDVRGAQRVVLGLVVEGDRGPVQGAEECGERGPRRRVPRFEADQRHRAEGDGGGDAGVTGAGAFAGGVDPHRLERADQPVEPGGATRRRSR